MDHVGDNCSFPLCNQHDFLPFLCSVCEFSFCLDHRSQKSHNCPSSQEQSENIIICRKCKCAVKYDDNVNEAIEEHSKVCVPLDVLNCTTCSKKVKYLVSCVFCQKHNCLKCRLPEIHKCSPHVQYEETKSAMKAFSNELIQRIQTNATQNSQSVPKKVITDPKKLEMLQKIEFMKMKHKAKGDASVPEELRVIVTIKNQIPSAKNKTELCTWLDKSKTVGWTISKLVKNDPGVDLSTIVVSFRQEDGNILSLHSSIDAISNGSTLDLIVV